jgi:hypothetical protein
MKANTVFVSLLAALAPLALGCVETTPIDILPAEATLVGAEVAPSARPQARLVKEAQKAIPASFHLFPREAKPFGKTYEEYAALWWQWALAVPKAQNPIFDGACDVNQSGNVFFLAGTTGGTATRTCTIPAGKGIFFPILNNVNRHCPEHVNADYTCDFATDDEFLHYCAAWPAENGTRTMTLEIDGVAIDGLDEYRAHSETFADTSPVNTNEGISSACSGPIRENSCGVPVGSPRKSVADGHWVMLHPLPVGKHKIHFAGTDVNEYNTFSLDVTYEIEVTP